MVVVGVVHVARLLRPRVFVLLVAEDSVYVDSGRFLGAYLRNIDRLV